MFQQNLRRRHAGYALFALALAAGLVALSPGSATADQVSASADYKLTITGTVPATCAFANNPGSLQIGDATNAVTTGQVRFSYKCNNIYSLTLKSKHNGVLQNAAGTESIAYKVDFARDDGSVTLSNSSLATPVTVSNLTKTAGFKNASLTINLDPTQYDQATKGDYTDDLTLTISGP